MQSQCELLEGKEKLAAEGAAKRQSEMEVRFDVLNQLMCFSFSVKIVLMRREPR